VKQFRELYIINVFTLA